MGDVEVVMNGIGDAHSLTFCVRPEGRGRMESMLLAQALRTLSNAVSRRIAAEHSGDDIEGVQALEGAGFRPAVILLTMRRLMMPSDINLPVLDGQAYDPDTA